jgi:hypothetical protein
MKPGQELPNLNTMRVAVSWLYGRFIFTNKGGSPGYFWDITCKTGLFKPVFLLHLCYRKPRNSKLADIIILKHPQFGELL